MLVAPEIELQLPPEVSQRCHWYAKLIGESPPHDPLDPLSVAPTWVVPPIVGGVVFDGATGVGSPAAADWTTGVGADVAEVEPI